MFRYLIVRLTAILFVAYGVDPFIDGPEGNQSYGEKMVRKNLKNATSGVRSITNKAVHALGEKIENLGKDVKKLGEETKEKVKEEVKALAEKAKN